MTNELICEGLCNPNIKAVDADVRTAREPELKDPDGTVHPLADTGLVRRLRALRHTAHARTAPLALGPTLYDRWQCASCGSVRTWGLLALVWLLTVGSASAQTLKPYCPPDGGPVGYAPADHPMVVQYPCSPYDGRYVPPDVVPAPTPIAPNAAQPWTLAPDQPMQVGHAYRDPYGLVYDVVGIQGPTTQIGQTGAYVAPMGYLLILHYQSEREWRAGQVSSIFSAPADRPRGVRWEIAR